MAFTFEIFPDRKLVESVATGEVTDEIILNHDRLLEKTKGFDPSFNHLVDLTAMTEDRITMKGFKELAENTPFDKTCRRAYIVTMKSQEQRAGFLAILMNAPDENFFLTQDREKAYNWLQEKPTRDVQDRSVAETGQN
jgi:hypothetical protein